MRNLKFLSLLITAKVNCSRYIRHYVESGIELRVMTKGIDFPYYLDSKQFYTIIFEKTINRVYPEIEIIGEENLNDTFAAFYLTKEKNLIYHYSEIDSFKAKLEEKLLNICPETKRNFSQRDDEDK